MNRSRQSTHWTACCLEICRIRPRLQARQRRRLRIRPQRLYSGLLRTLPPQTSSFCSISPNAPSPISRLPCASTPFITLYFPSGKEYWAGIGLHNWSPGPLRFPRSSAQRTGWWLWREDWGVYQPVQQSLILAGLAGRIRWMPFLILDLFTFLGCDLNYATTHAPWLWGWNRDIHIWFQLLFLILRSRVFWSPFLWYIIGSDMTYALRMIMIHDCISGCDAQFIDA